MKLQDRLRAMGSTLAFFAVVFLFFGGQSVNAQESQCVKCHTSSGKLIKITRSLAKNKPTGESKSKGPG